MPSLDLFLRTGVTKCDRTPELEHGAIWKIGQYGDEQFEVAHSNSYRDKLKRRFAVLAEQPQLYPAVEHIRLGYHRSVCGAHSIYYPSGRMAWN